MARIRVLQPNVTQQEALRLLRSGLSAALWRVRAGPLRRIASVCVPYRLYQVRYSMGGARVSRFLALEAVQGALDLFEFPRPPQENEFVAMETRNQLGAALDESRAAELLREKALRAIFLQGFFKLRDTALEIHRQPGELHLPYWLGFYGSGNALRCRAIDAIRRRVEGAKAAAFFEDWLAGAENHAA